MTRVISGCNTKAGIHGFESEIMCDWCKGVIADGEDHDQPHDENCPNYERTPGEDDGKWVECICDLHMCLGCAKKLDDCDKAINETLGAT